MATTAGYEIVWQHLGRYNATSKIRKTQLKAEALQKPEWQVQQLNLPSFELLLSRGNLSNEITSPEYLLDSQMGVCGFGLQKSPRIQGSVLNMTEAVGLEGTCKHVLPPPSQGQYWEQSEGTKGQAPMQMCAKLQEQDMEKALKQF